MARYSRILLGALLSIPVLEAQADDSVFSCSVSLPSDAVLVALALPGLGKADVLLQWYGDEGAGDCSAVLELPPERLPSLRLVPRLEDLAQPVGVVAHKLWSATQCDAGIVVLPRSFDAYQPDADVDVFGNIVLERGAWVAREESDWD